MRERLHFLDWLRVIAFALLVLYHVGMFYVSWGWHVKSPRLVEDAEWAMVLVNPWRLALLFFISGVATHHLLAKLRPGGFARDRVVRLLPTIVFGMLVIVPPQAYFELLESNRYHGTYLEFWIGPYLQRDLSYGIELPTWNHLWFLVYLFFYSLIVAIAARTGVLARVRAPVALLIGGTALWLCATNVLASEVWPDTHGLFDDWAGHLRWGGIYVVGLLAARSDAFWPLLRRRRGSLAIISLALATVFVAVRAAIHAQLIAEAWDGPLYSVASGLFGWTAILGLVGYAMEYLSRPSPVLRYLNVAILPVYVLHQTLIIVIAIVMVPLELPLVIEVVVLVVGTFGGSFALYELVIRRVGVLRRLFGLKSS